MDAKNKKLSTSKVKLQENFQNQKKYLINHGDKMPKLKNIKSKLAEPQEKIEKMNKKGTMTQEMQDQGQTVPYQPHMLERYAFVKILGVSLNHTSKKLIYHIAATHLKKQVEKIIICQKNDMNEITQSNPQLYFVDFLENSLVLIEKQQE